MKRPFPIRRSNTITRGNIVIARIAIRETDPDPDNADKAAYVAGFITGHPFLLKQRHIDRCQQLMKEKA